MALDRARARRNSQNSSALGTKSLESLLSPLVSEEVSRRLEARNEPSAFAKLAMGTDETPIMPPSRSPAIRPAGETSTQLLRRNRSPLETSFFSRKTPPSSGLLTSTMERHAVKETELWKGQAARLTDELAREKRDAEYFRDKVAVLEEQLKVLNDKLNENFLCRSAATGAPSVPDMLKSQLSYQEENIELKVEIEEAKKKIQEVRSVRTDDAA